MEYKDYFKKESVVGKLKDSPKNLNVDPEELKSGEADELEHTEDPKLASIISKHHLKDDPHYYSKLKSAGLEEEDVDEHCGACEDDLGDEYDDNGGLPTLGGALAIPHRGQPIMMSKIINVGGIKGGPSSGELSGMTNVTGVAKDQGGVKANSAGDKEPITAGGHSLDSSIATKSVGGQVVSGEGQKQGGPNSQGTIASTPKLAESKAKVRKIVKEVLKEIRFDKQTGKWVRIDEAGHKAGCKCGFCANKNKFGKKKKEDKEEKEEMDENKFASMNPDNPSAQTPSGQLGMLSGKNSKKKICKNCGNNIPTDAGRNYQSLWGKPCVPQVDENTVDMKMGPSYKKIQPRQYKTAEDDFARTNQYDPEITEMYDDEEECMMNERYVELANAGRNLSESELSELKTLREKIDRLAEEVKKCPDCGTPNQFGELCQKCRNDNQSDIESVDENEDDYERQQYQRSISQHNRRDPQRFPCPTCKKPNALSSWEKKQGYQCNSCANAEEGPMGGDFGGGEYQQENSGENVSGVKEGWAMGEYTQPQQQAIDILSGKGFREVSSFPGEPDADGGGMDNTVTVVMQKKQGPSRLSAEIDPDGSVNGQPVEQFLQGQDVKETVNMKMGPSYKTVSQSQDRCVNCDQARTIQYDPKMTEAGGQAVQHTSYRTVGNGNLPQSGKQRWADDMDEGTKKPSTVVKTIKKGMKAKSGAFKQKLTHQKPKKTTSGVHKRKT